MVNTASKSSCLMRGEAGLRSRMQGCGEKIEQVYLPVTVL